MAKTKKRTAAKKSAAKKTAAKKPTKKELEQQEHALLERLAHRRQVAAVALVFVGVLLEILALVEGGTDTVYSSIHGFYLGVWGISAYTFPIILLVFAFLLSRGKETDRPYFFLLWSCVLSLFIVSIVHVLRCSNLDSLDFGSQISEEYYHRETFGGVFGAVLGGLVYLICGKKALSAVLLVVLSLLIVFLLSHARVDDVFRRLARPVERVGGETVRRLRAEREARAERAAEGNETAPL
ncbi:MAG: DNA translocase FtsK 4TM domain-containing protein, partial [Clostridia bacterium]|nr:DNA translocase FtsK 4TM domain-containing protein [Clostridia bacterium]